MHGFTMGLLIKSSQSSRFSTPSGSGKSFWLAAVDTILGLDPRNFSYNTVHPYQLQLWLQLPLWVPVHALHPESPDQDPHRDSVNLMTTSSPAAPQAATRLRTAPGHRPIASTTGWQLGPACPSQCLRSGTLEMELPTTKAQGA